MAVARPFAAPSASPSANEYEIKAAAFLNIISFTQWPNSAFTSPDAPLVVGVVGDGPIAGLIDRTMRNETWHGRSIVIEHFETFRDIKRCHVLFIARSQRGNWNEIRHQYGNEPVLAVSDAANFAVEGGAIQLAIERNKLRIFVNLAATHAKKLRLSSNLLHLATIVGPLPVPGESPESGLPIVPAGWFSVCLAVQL